MSVQVTSAQKSVVKAWLDANAVALSDDVAAAALNALASPDYWVLKTVLSRHDLTDVSGLDVDGVTVTNFVWGGTAGGFISRSQGERDAFGSIFNREDNILPNRANLRTALDDIFSGTGAGAVANRAHFRAVSRRKASVLEKLFVIATLGGPTQLGLRGAATNPDTLVIEGTISGQQVSDIRLGL